MQILCKINTYLSLFNNNSNKNCIIATIWPWWEEFGLCYYSMTSNTIVMHQLVSLTANDRVVFAIAYKIWPTEQNYNIFFSVPGHFNCYMYIRPVA